MAFYLKKTKLKGRTYLSIDESFIVMKRKEPHTNVTNPWVLLKHGRRRELKTQFPIFKKKWML